MKLAILLLCHKNPKQINKFLEVMQHPQISFFIHIDKKNNFADSIIKKDSIYILPHELCYNIQWSSISIVQATLNLIEFAASKGEFNYFWLCSGQDFPIKPIKDIVSFFENKTCNFINLFNSQNSTGKYTNYDKRNSLYYPKWIMENTLLQRILKRVYVEITGGYNKTLFFSRKNIANLKFYFGSQWWCLNSKTIKWIIKYCKEHKEYLNFYKNCATPDESFFHTLVFNSPYKNNVSNYLHYIDWLGCKNSPRILTIKDFDKIKKSNYLMARKFDIDETLIKNIIEEIL